MFVQSGNIISTNIYRDDDKPLYRRGNKILLAICSFNILLFYLVKLFYIWRNKVRDRRWNAMTKEEQQDYLLTTKDEARRTKAKYSICNKNVYNFNEAGFLIGKITTQLIVTASERRGHPKAIQLGGRNFRLHAAALENQLPHIMHFATRADVLPEIVNGRSYATV
ncbi:hypothetical protein yc1106_05276 [Curvularia clavata]|uniref:Uncharacterized protein n=1 Tax=Curvularia clavata TaxID=95742 RepID=A0A9Q8Z9E2_CURCL|nr:hypothetical protein yc1106_05276 [Curvularia clavata]